MVKQKNPTNNPQEWIEHLSQLRGEIGVKKISAAIGLYNDATSTLLKKGIGISDILLSLGLDNDTLAVAIIYPAYQAHELHHEQILEALSMEADKLLHDIQQMQSLSKLQNLEARSLLHIENLRKMLLAMVSDVRAVLIILAERLWQLRHAKQLDRTEQIKLANETLKVHAPLANRLGVWQLKWEIEDLCLRCLQPEIYTEIAKGLTSRRQEREEHIQRVIAIISDLLKNANIQNAEVTGRVKHIYSIYNKMKRKNVSLDKIYDVGALRVLVPEISDCYSVLSLLQNEWEQIPEEFDDYITHPKPNGYRSIHTVLLGPEARIIEVQIRTHQMHQESELGVAAHWRYKEGVLQTSDYEAKIALLRQIMAWQKEIVGEEKINSKRPLQDLFADRVYVFTPLGDIVDLPQGATPLDFAYQIHSEVGHRCRGAKVDGNIIPLTHLLKTGERVEILTAKTPNPSRDWLNPQLGYLNTARARAKVQHWFKIHDSIQNIAAGREILDKEIKRLRIHERVDLNSIAIKLNYKTGDDMLAALGGGDLGVTPIINQVRHARAAATPPPVSAKAKEGISTSGIQISGVNNLLTQIARCCKPLPGDAIIGYITRTNGISIHRRDCGNVMHTTKNNKSRLVEVSWKEKASETHPVDLIIRANDRAGLLRDITTLLTTEKINIYRLETHKYAHSTEAHVYLSIDISSVSQLKKAVDLLAQITGVSKVIRR